jgi:bifunctional DNase/RNase
LKEDTFYAAIHLSVDGKEMEIDARPSDAIALAVRVEVPIYCAERVMEAAAELGLLKQRSDFDETEDLKKWLEHLKPDDFGKYKM